MIGKNLILSLKSDAKGLPRLCYDLGLKIVSEDINQIVLNLPAGIAIIKKSDWFNYHNTPKFRIYDDGNVFFILCNKHVNANYAFSVLLDYACSKIDNRISKLEGLKESYKKLIAA